MTAQPPTGPSGPAPIGEIRLPAAARGFPARLLACPGLLLKRLVLVFGGLYFVMVAVTNVVNFVTTVGGFHWTFLTTKLASAAGDQGRARPAAALNRNDPGPHGSGSFGFLRDHSSRAKWSSDHSVSKAEDLVERQGINARTVTISFRARSARSRCPARRCRRR
jgi:hypothetical protein